LKYILSAVNARHTAFTTTPLVVGAVCVTSQAVSLANIGQPIVKVGKFASALIVHCNKIVQASQSVQATTTIHIAHLQSPSAQAAALASQASRLLSVRSRYTRSPNACVYHDVAVIVVQLRFPSALSTQSSCTLAFSSSTVGQESVLLLSASLQAKVAKSAPVRAVLNSASVPVIHTIVV